MPYVAYFQFGEQHLVQDLKIYTVESPLEAIELARAEFGTPQMPNAIGVRALSVDGQDLANRRLARQTTLAERLKTGNQTTTAASKED